MDRSKRGKRLAGAFDKAGGALDDYATRGDRTAEFRQRVRTLAESQWGEPVDLFYLKDFGPAFDVPGRREYGTRRGTRLVRRFFWNILHGAVNGVANVFLFFASGGGGTSPPPRILCVGCVPAQRGYRGGLWLSAVTFP
jgi:hypothetical protein